MSDSQPRRQFIRNAACALLCGAVASCAGPGSPFPGLSAQIDVHGLEKPGDWRVSDTPGPDGAPILVVRTEKGFNAFSMQCPHAGCTVTPPENGKLTCPCHDSQFALSGA